ncbi:BLUF domain-containing protein [Thalassolituus hydrocarboniclasticus]|uniref:BLUF domain-containing protein n=1 Tax=Thalassolituus hydrocarboniclasticus TaxID=2742796 RepID=A0ABY6A751_9GAMM|nr:BLUF domain-containing protein [Thalassolituus hydrocarboniclasticus]UXD86448.1 BLUF domain-containing protein [Thalassolituus hydrocarboniclasticus]
MLIRLVYASHASFSVGNDRIDPRLGRILTQSRSNNARREIGGVLYLGDGYFLQCLEGEAAAVDALYQRICEDSRHHNQVILSRSTIEKRLFRNWSMKYIPAEKSVRTFLRSRGYDYFNPFELSQDDLDLLVQYFHELQVNIRDASAGEEKETRTEQPFWRRWLVRFSG